MFNISYFKERDLKIVKEFMHHNPFVTLCGCDADSRPVATQIPVLIEEREGKLFLLGHVMKKTDHHLAFEQNPTALAIFSGAHTYVSASWYSNPQTASTWNYMSVHARGSIHFLDEPGLLDVLKRLTAHFENNSHSPSLVEKLPGDYVEKMMKAIIAFEMEVTELDNVFKLSQNRDESSYENIIGKLHESGENGAVEIAGEMEKRKMNYKN